VALQVLQIAARQDVGEGVDFPHRPILATRLGVTVFIPWGLSHAPRRPETRLVPFSDS